MCFLRVCNEGGHRRGTTAIHEAMLACFSFSSGPQLSKLRNLCRIMGMSADQVQLCQSQYTDNYLRAQEHFLGDTGGHVVEGWAFAAAAGRADVLMNLVGVLASCLIAETSCERAFAIERRQFDNRPRLSEEARFVGLKVMVDGVPLKDLQRGGRPISDFWNRAQNVYAEKFGSRFLVSLRPRKDKGTKRPGRHARRTEVQPMCE